MSTRDLGSRLAVSEEVLADWISTQRWFGAKARDVAQFNILDVVVLRREPPALALTIVEARFGAGTHELYHVPIGVRAAAEDWTTEVVCAAEDFTAYDALADAEQTALLALLLGSGAVVEDGESSVEFWWEGGQAVGPGTPSRKMGVEQSNTSIVFDERLVLKVFRKVEPGINPELEMLRFLAGHGFEHIAKLEGWFEYSGELMDATLGVMQQFIPGAVDGWHLAQDALLETDGDFFARLEELGAVTGRMHAALASDSENPDFAPEEPSDENVSLLSATIDEQIERVFLELPDHPALAPIVGRGPDLRDRLQLLSHIGIGGRLIRGHGDYHLGQTVLGPDGWVVLDFEGEPGRPLRERRRKHSPLRDVAGMLRSISNAALAGELLFDLPAASPDWEARARERFLRGYLAEVDQNLLPAGRQAIEKLLSIFELDKLLYELRYELNNRPDWLAVPVTAIARLLDEPFS
ncbi:MAG: maltokinase N-terminal cap-like domain-containing protein [Solirubrobacteraceae bacterium]